MAEWTTRQQADGSISITKADGSPATVDGVPVWASSDETVLTVTASADGMSAVVSTVAAGGPARVSVSADADLGAGTLTITGVSEDITVVVDPRDQASQITIVLGAPVDKP